MGRQQSFNKSFGVVYQPSEPISLYASYSQSFSPVIGRSQDGSTFTPERGTQYEVGIKADMNEDLSATLAAFDITKTNVLTSDPDNSNFSIQVGAQRSQGIELIITGEILPGWNISGGYAYTNARSTKDNSIPEGDFLSNVPENTANLWTTYEVQSGDFQGLGLGLGIVSNLVVTHPLSSGLVTVAWIISRKLIIFLCLVCHIKEKLNKPINYVSN